MSKPSERIWIIYHFDEGERGELIPNPTAVSIGMAELGVLASRIGGTFTLATRRREIAPGQVETIATIVRWRSFVPLEKAQEAPPAEQEAGHPATPPPPGAEEVLAITDEPIVVPEAPAAAAAPAEVS